MAHNTKTHNKIQRSDNTKDVGKRKKQKQYKGECMRYYLHSASGDCKPVTKFEYFKKDI